MSRIILALAAAAVLSACGVRGDLERPDPLWNSEDAIRRECQRQLERNEPQDPRCARYQSGAEQSSLNQHEVTGDIAHVSVTLETPNRSTIPEIMQSPDTPSGQ